MAIPYASSSLTRFDSWLLQPNKGLLHTRKIGWMRVSDQSKVAKITHQASALSTPHIAPVFPPHEVLQSLFISDLDPSTAKVAIGFVGPFLSAFGFLFVARIVMSWYPKIPVGEFPYVLAYAPTEPILSATRKVIPPLGGVDVTPVVWFGLVSFLNEILVGPQGLLVLLSQQV